MNTMRKIKYQIMALMACMAFGCLSLTSCSDEPDAEYFYTFEGEMMSDYMKNRSEYSEFAQIVTRANLMDMLSSYGMYTCFLPNNGAVNNYLSSRGLSSVDQLSDADCDTIARTHIIGNMYSTSEMDQDRIPTANMLGRYLSTKIDSVTAEVLIENMAHIISTLQDDSVENGIVQPIDHMLEKSNSYISDMLRNNPTISYFYAALEATGVKEDIMLVEDPNYNAKDYPKYYYKSHTWNEVGWAPDTRKYGFTCFVEPNTVYDQAFQDKGISTGSGSQSDILKAMYDLACQLYDPVYPDDVAKEGHKFANLKDPVNPLRRFVQYHIINRYVAGTDDLTAMEISVGGKAKKAFGFETEILNPIDWYTTLLPHTMAKIEQLTAKKRIVYKSSKWVRETYDFFGKGIENERYLNRRYDEKFKHEGAHIFKATEDTEYKHDAINGYYFYVDNIVAFSKEVRDEVQNMRIRMDFSAIFPEIMTNDMRLKGNPLADDDASKPDDAVVPKNGRNYYFPLGYLDGVTFSKNSYLVMRRPHIGFWSWQGDEWNIFGDYDLTMRIPPVPFSGMWQMRLGFCAIETRGVMQVYFGDDPDNLIPQGIPLDMMKYLDSDLYLGDRFVLDENMGDYDKKDPEEKAEEQKLLKNLNAYRAGRGTFHYDGSGTHLFFTGNNRTYRRILCTSYVDATKDYYLRFRVASDGKQGNNNEFMLDYFEMVPSSVYAVDGDGAMEDDI